MESGLQPLKVILVGDSGVGKTSIIRTFVDGKEPADSVVTVGVDVARKAVVLENGAVMLGVWDTGGQERFGSIVPSFYRGDVACLVVVFSLADRKTFDLGQGRSNLKRWLEEEARHRMDQDAPVVVVGHKSDLVDSRQVSHKEASAWCQDYGQVPYVETSVKDPQSIQDAFRVIGMRAAAGRTFTPVPSPPPKPARSPCCGK